MMLKRVLNGSITPSTTTRKLLPRNPKGPNHTPRNLKSHFLLIQIKVRLNNAGEGIPVAIRFDPYSALLAFKSLYKLRSVFARSEPASAEEIRQDAAFEEADDDKVVRCLGCDDFICWFLLGVHDCYNGIECRVCGYD